MTIAKTVSATAFALLTLAPVSLAQINGDYLAVDATEVFVPNGFDDNDEVVVVVDGWLPDGCYRLVKPETIIDHETQTISVTPMARWWDIPCIEMLIPYNFEVRVGVLPYGEYKVKINKALDITENLDILEATNSGPDEHLYAPVEDAAVVKAEDGKQMGKISGRFTNSCMTLKNVDFTSNGKTVVVLPMAELKDADTECALGIFPFEKKFALPTDLSTGRHLMHVRSLNGYDLNVMFDHNNRG